MKKLLGIFAILLCLCLVLVMPTAAAGDPLAEAFQEALGLLDHFYDYDYDYMIRIASDQFITWGEDMWKPVTVSAAEFDAVLHDYFVITDSQIAELREYGNNHYQNSYYDEELGEEIYYDFFDPDANTYTFQYYGGFGGSLPTRSYLGYVNNGQTYDVYYQNIHYAYLQDYLPEGVDEWEYAESLQWPEYIEMEGIRFENGPDGYYTVLSYDDFGRKYTVEMNGDIVRLISCVNYTAEDLPDAFDDRNEVIYDLPQDGDITIEENDCFTPGTVVQAEKLSQGDIYNVVVQSMETVASQFSVFEFTATLDGAAVQPNGTMAVTFAIPQGYSTDLSVYYMAPNGTLELIPFTVDAAAGTVTAQLSHFSTYILADNASKPHVHAYTDVVSPPTCTTEGYTTHTCACGDTYVDSKVGMTDHSYGQWTQITAPTAEQAGEEKRVCADCDHFETRSIAKLDSAPATTPDATPDETPDEGMPVGLIIGIAAALVAVAILAIVLIKKKK